LREIKLLRLLKHPDIVEIKHIMLPPSPRDYKDIYVVFELLETDLHQVFLGHNHASNSQPSREQQGVSCITAPCTATGNHAAQQGCAA
jgi:serine/threonine protein kinase